MIGIIVTSVVCLLGLALLFVFFLPTNGRSREHPAGQTHRPVAGLSATSMDDLNVLFRSDDYLTLSAVPELRSVRKKFWRDRRRIALIWLGELQADVHILWEFRRFLVRNGLQVTLRQEAGIAYAASVAWLCLSAVRLAVFVFGPFALLRSLRNTKSLVEQLSSRDVALLARVSAPEKAEIEQSWTHHLQLLRTEIRLRAG